MGTKIFVNLAVKDLKRSVDFVTDLGYKFDPQFTDDNATCLVIAEDIYAMLLVEDFFKTFTKKQLTHASTHTEAIIALSAESREAVDQLVDKALPAGGSAANEPLEMGGM
jgi:predicted lactoylglutathione lyase